MRSAHAVMNANASAKSLKRYVRASLPHGRGIVRPPRTLLAFHTGMSRRILIGIAGGSGSGKTVVARTIVRELGSRRVVIIDQDSYYRNLEQVPFRDREARNFDHPDAFDSDLLRQHLRELLAGHSIDQPVYDY